MIYAGYETQEEIDHQLSYGMVGPKRDEAYANFVEGAYRARETFSPKLDLMYGPADRHRLDYFPTPNGSESAPTIIFFHGGSWRLSDKFFANFWAEAFCPAGYNFIAATYGFLPLFSLDQIIEHARLAISWVHENHSKLNIDPTRLIVSGNSAGAHLAMMAMVNDWEDSTMDPNHILGCFGFSGIYDLEMAHHSTSSRQYVTNLQDAKAWSPYKHTRPGLPPAFIVYGEDETDEFARQSKLMHQSWIDSGNESTLIGAPDGNHYNTQWFGRTVGNPLHTQLMEFLAKVCDK